MNEHWVDMVRDMYLIQSTNVLPRTFQLVLAAWPIPTDAKVLAAIAKQTREALPKNFDDADLRHFVLDKATPEQAMIVQLAIQTALRMLESFRNDAPEDQIVALATMISDGCISALVERGLDGLAGELDPEPNP